MIHPPEVVPPTAREVIPGESEELRAGKGEAVKMPLVACSSCVAIDVAVEK
jgi:hypothetical protein